MNGNTLSDFGQIQVDEEVNLAAVQVGEDVTVQVSEGLALSEGKPQYR